MTEQQFADALRGTRAINPRLLERDGATLAEFNIAGRTRLHTKRCAVVGVGASARAQLLEWAMKAL